MDKKLLDFGIDCLSRYALVTHGCMVGKDSHYDRIFHQVIRLKSIEEIEVRMTGCSRDAILDELETGQADSIKRNVVSTANTLDRDGRETEVAKGFHPGCEFAARELVSLEKYPAECPCTIILVEINRELLVVWFSSSLWIPWIPEVLEDIFTRTVDSLLLASPESHFNRAARLSPDRLKDTRGFEDDCTA